MRLSPGKRAVLFAGQRVNRLFGVNMSGAEFAPGSGQTFPAAADWDYLKRKGIRFVRLPIAWESIQPTLSAALDATYLASLRAALAAAYARGIGVIVDLHNFGCKANATAWNSTVTYAGNAGAVISNVNVLGDATLTSAVFADTWTRLATALGGTPGLMGYELMNEAIGVIGANLLYTPNYFGRTTGAQPWITLNAANPTILAAGTNPLGANYGPAWSIDSGSGFGAVQQTVTVAAVPHSLSGWAKVPAGSDTAQLVFGASSANNTATTSWQRFALRNITPSAGAVNVQLGSPNAAGGHQIQIANAMLNLGATELTYEPNQFYPFAQAAITAIRAIDATTPIYVSGAMSPQASGWQQWNFEATTLTGGNLIFEAHQYFDGAQGVGGPSTYSGTWSSYSIDNNSGTQALAAFIAWLRAFGLNGFIGEYGVPDSTADANVNWKVLQANAENLLVQNAIPRAMWFFNSNGGQGANILGVAPKSGVDDPRLMNALTVR